MLAYMAFCRRMAEVAVGTYEEIRLRSATRDACCLRYALNHPVDVAAIDGLPGHGSQDQTSDGAFCAACLEDSEDRDGKGHGGGLVALADEVQHAMVTEQVGVVLDPHYAHPAIPQLEFYDRAASWVASQGALLIGGHLHHDSTADHHHEHGHDHGDGLDGPPAAPDLSGPSQRHSARALMPGRPASSQGLT